MTVALPRPHQPEVGDDRTLQHVLETVELLGLLRWRGDEGGPVRRHTARACRPLRPGSRHRCGCRTRRSRNLRRASARPAFPAASARPPARPRGTGARTPCSRRRRTQPRASAARRSATARGPNHRPRRCWRRPQGHRRRLPAAHRQVSKGCHTARTHRRPGVAPDDTRATAAAAESIVLSIIFSVCVRGEAVNHRDQLGGRPRSGVRAPRPHPHPQLLTEPSLRPRRPRAARAPGAESRADSRA